MAKDGIAEQQLELFNSEQVEKHIPDMIFVVLVCLVGIAGNSVTSTFFWNKMGRNVHSFFLTILSLNDLFTSFILLDNLFDTVYAVTFTSEVGCKLLASVNRCLITSSFVLIVLIAVDRFLKIFLMSPRIMFSVRTSKIAVVAVYIFTVSTTVPEIILTEPIKVNITSARNETFAGYFCHRGESNDSDKQLVIKIYKSVELGMVVFLLTCMIVIYSLIAFRVAQSKKRILRAKRQDNCVLNIENKSKDSSNLNISEKKEASDEETFDVTDQNTDNVTVDDFAFEMTNSPQVITIVKNIDIPIENIDEPDQSTAVVPMDDISFETNNRPHVITKVKSIDIPVKTIDEPDKNTADVTVAEMSLENIYKPKILTKVETVKHMDIHVKTKRDRKTKRKNPQPTRQDRNIERSITFTMLVMTLASVLTFVPYFIVEFAVHEEQYEHSVWMRILSRSYILNSSINPFIIWYFNPPLRDYFKRVVQRMKLR
ncbi:uncharacterized protein LOC128235199 [Mya arenaria]|uniref:uncharacterized protein LOC128235199 n=1 Tax=Mya arenaria TaxID=6604 RepID=UPI0022E8EE9A|nr:uncharacterized protein LOC128235199 [Mya arenaria]